MFSLRRAHWSMLLLVSVLSLAGCGPSDSVGSPPSKEPATPAVPPVSQPATPPDTVPPNSSTEWKREEIPYDYDAMKEDVRIQLAEEPRLHSPLRTTVGITPQAYTFFFREAMDRSSVEAAIRLHAKDTTSVHFIQPEFSFHWVHDRQLHLLATLPSPPEPDKAWPEYVLNAAGAKTANGKQIGENSAFYAVALSPAQMWGMSLDGKQKEKLTDFSAPYIVADVLDPERRFLLLFRYREYCECDARYVPLYAIYDRDKKTITRYPVELTVNYRGEGAFVADRRGFLYAQPKAGVEVPSSELAVPIKVDGFVHGASFSHDRRYVLMAVGAPEQKKDLDLVIYDLEKGTERSMAGAVKGTIPTSEADGVVLPVRFDDDGRYATFMMRESEVSLVEIRQRYDWETGKVVNWDPPVPKDSWSGYVQSDDRLYQMYWNAGLFKGSTFILESNGTGVWIPGTHQFAYTKWEGSGTDGSSFTQSLRLFDADRKQESVLFTGLPSGLVVIGASEDGKWLYVVSDKELGR